MIEPNAAFRVVGDAADGIEAVQKAQALNPDLILLDIGLPKINGIEAVSRIREVAPRARILFLTGINDQDVAKAALRTGAQGYVLKIDAPSELLAAMTGVLGGDEFVSSGLKSEKRRNADIL